MKSCRTQILSLILGGLIAQPVQAEVIPGRWEKVSAMEMASPIVVELKSGDRIKGQFRGLSASDLELLSPAGWAVIPKSDIRTITSPSKDGLGDGAKIGAGIGAGIVVGAVGIAAMAQNKGDAASAPMLMLILGGGAAGIGAGHKNRRHHIVHSARNSSASPAERFGVVATRSAGGRDGGTPKFTMTGTGVLQLVGI